MATLEQLGWDEFFAAQVTEEEHHRFAPARVAWASRGRYRLVTGNAESPAGLAGRLRHDARSGADLPAVGDWVLATFRSDDGGVTIHRVLERRTAFRRAAAGRAAGTQVVVANADTALLVTSVNQDFNVRRLERYLALAWESGARPVIVLKQDGPL